MSGTRMVAGNLRWTDGMVWADYLLTGVPYGLLSAGQKQRARAEHTLLLRSLVGESILLGVIAQDDPAEIVGRMIADLDLAATPQWVAECEASLETLDQIVPGRRLYYLSVPLQVGSLRATAAETWDSLLAGLGRSAGLPWRPPSTRRLRELRDRAEQIRALIPPCFDPRPATPAQMAWLHAHTTHRGLAATTAFPSSGSLEEQLWTPRSGVTVSGAVLDEGARTDAARVTQSLPRKVLKVTDVDDVSQARASYQAFLALAAVPEVMPFPDGEFLGRIDAHGLPVDWALRMSSQRGSKRLQANDRAEINLKDQLGDGDGDDAQLSRGVRLGKSARALSELVAALSDSQEVEIQALVVLCVSAPTAEGATAQATALATSFETMGYKLASRLGYQEAMWWAMQPATPTPRTLRQYAQITTSEALSAAVPLIGAQLGDDTGLLLGVHIPHSPLIEGDTATTPAAAVLMDPEGASDRRQAFSVVTGGSRGYGKTATLMTIASHLVDRGSQLVIADRTEKGEWASWAAGVADTQVIDLTTPQRSADPLRVLGVRAGAGVLTSTMTTLLRTPTTRGPGALLVETLRPDYLTAHQLTTAHDWAQHLHTLTGTPDAAELARTVDLFAHSDLCRALFDPDLPALSLEAGALVFRTYGLDLPSPEEIAAAHLFETLPMEKIVGRAFYALVLWIAQHLCFRDTSRLATLISSEAWAAASSPEAVKALTTILRDGRKHRSGLMLDSQDPLVDLPDPTLRSLIAWRIAVHCDDPDLAERCARWLIGGQHPDPAQLRDIVAMIEDLSPKGVGNTTPLHRRGEAVVRTPYPDQIERIKILLPSRTERRQAIITGGNAAARRRGAA